MRMEPCWCDSKMATQPVDVLHKSHIHLQSPLPGGLLCMSDINAGTPGAGQGESFRDVRGERKLSEYEWSGVWAQRSLVGSLETHMPHAFLLSGGGMGSSGDMEPTQ